MNECQGNARNEAKLSACHCQPSNRINKKTLQSVEAWDTSICLNSFGKKYNIFTFSFDKLITNDLVPKLQVYN